MTQRKAAQIANDVYRRVHTGELTRKEGEKILRSVLHYMSDSQMYSALDFFHYNRLCLVR